MFFRGKKGDMNEELWKILFEIFLVLGFAAALFWYVNGVIEDNAVFSDIYSKDTALLTDSLHGAPGDMALRFDIKEDLQGDIDFRFRDGWADTRSAGADKFRYSFPFGKDDNINAFGENKTIESATGLIFRKENQTVTAEGTDG